VKPKPWYASKTLIGALVMILSLLARQSLGRDLTPEETTTLSEWLTTAGDLIGLTLVVWGRWTATRRIKTPKGLGLLAIVLLGGCSMIGARQRVGFEGVRSQQPSPNTITSVGATSHAAQTVPLTWIVAGEANSLRPGSGLTAAFDFSGGDAVRRWVVDSGGEARVGADLIEFDPATGAFRVEGATAFMASAEAARAQNEALDRLSVVWRALAAEQRAAVEAIVPGLADVLKGLVP